MDKDHRPFDVSKSVLHLCPLVVHKDDDESIDGHETVEDIGGGSDGPVDKVVDFDEGEMLLEEALGIGALLPGEQG